MWQTKYIKPAFDESKHEEMIKNFGYVSIEKYDFKLQQSYYNQTESDKRLTEDIKCFIGFMAGTGFFIKFNVSLNEWLAMKNWHNPYIKKEDEKSINELLEYNYGINYIKVLLTQMPYWRR